MFFILFNLYLNFPLKGPVFFDIDNREFYATLGMRGPKQKVKFNFGKEPFRFDLNLHVKNEKDAIM